MCACLLMSVNHILVSPLAAEWLGISRYMPLCNLCKSESLLTISCQYNGEGTSSQQSVFSKTCFAIVKHLVSFKDMPLVHFVLDVR